MSRTLLFILLLLTTLQSLAQEKINFTIKGKVLNARDSTSITFTNFYPDTSITIPLSADKSFIWQSSLPGPGTWMFSTCNSTLSVMWIGKGETTITFEQCYPNDGDTTERNYLKPLDVSGSPESVAAYQFDIQWSNLSARYSHLSKEDREDSIMSIMYPGLSRYILANPRSDHAASLLLRYPINNLQRSALLGTLDRQVDPIIIQNIKNQLKRQTAHSPGVSIPDWKQPRLDGSLFSLHSIKTNYILLDFWNSKCIPCRRANPSLIRLYNEYHSKGFEIVGISLDTKLSEWKKAVEQDKLPWIQVSDLKGWQNKISSWYVIRRNPYNILINNKYEVVATDLSPRQLEARLKQLLPPTN